MRFGFVGPSYTARSTAIADEECINLYLETMASQSTFSPQQVAGANSYAGLRSLLYTPGLLKWVTLPETPVRGQIIANGRYFAVAGGSLYEVSSTGTITNRGSVANDSKAASLAYSLTQVLIVSGGKSYCFTLATNALLDVTSQMADVPVMVQYTKTYFVVLNASGKYQMSNPLDGTTWPGQLVNETEFGDIPNSIIVNHDELWVFGPQHCQPFQNTGSANIFDAGVPLIEVGNAATFSPCRVDNSIFWIGQDERGSRIAWRSNGYTPQRISTYAVEVDLSSYADISGMTSYSYQDSGHIFWVLYIPGSQWSWVYDVSEQVWHKRAEWVNNAWTAQWSWNHAYAFGMHLVGDWNSGNIYQLSQSTYMDNGQTKRWLRRAPVLMQEMNWIVVSQLTIDLQPGLGPIPPLTDGNGNPRGPQIMLRVSRDRGNTWGPELTADCGQAGQYTTRAVFFRLGRSRYAIFEVSASDPIPWAIVDAYIEVAQ